MEEMIILIVIFLFTIIQKIKFKEILYHSFKERIIITLVIFVVMMSWEFYSKSKGIWLFPGPGMVGIYILGLPLELYLFYLIFPYFVFVFYETMHLKLDSKKNVK